jgi:L-ascorbate metabolism protein UlaG (beta-lactamase superfamily)
MRPNERAGCETDQGISMRITWYSHSCFRIETGGAVLLIDPFLKGNPAFEASKASWKAATAGVTHVALTHGHDDHIGDAAEICTANGATLLSVYELAAHVKGQSAIKIEPMNTGGRVVLPDFSLTLTQALHSSSSNGVYLGNPCGIVIQPTASADRDKVVYHMGDTDMFAGMALIAELHQPAIGIVPIGDRFTMGAKAAAFACKKFFHFKTIIPCHYGTFPGMLDPDASQFVSHMSGENVIVPAIGAATDL